MKLPIRILLSLCAAALFATPACADWLYPYSGWWGAGYYASPAYAPSYAGYSGTPSYTSFYGSYYSGSPSYGCCGTAAPVYAASYGSYGSGCCATSCCDSCGSSGCSTGSCVGTTPAGSLKPAQDPISNEKSRDYEDRDGEREFRPFKTKPSGGNSGDFPDSRDETEEKDPFMRSRPGTEDGTNSGSGDDTFRNDLPDPATDRTNRKPAVTEPQDENADDPADSNPGAPVDEKTFYNEKTSKRDNSVSRGRNTIVARTGSLSEVIAPKRLASRSLPASQRSASSSKLADKANGSQSVPPQPLRWISAPLAEGHVQL